MLRVVTHRDPDSIILGIQTLISKTHQEIQLTTMRRDFLHLKVCLKHKDLATQWKEAKEQTILILKAVKIFKEAAKVNKLLILIMAHQKLEIQEHPEVAK